jgi:SAM-dependent methyltransferase
MDKFYTDFEDRFRGSEAMIMERQEEYLSFFNSSKIDFKKTPVLDIGSGRGEFIQLLNSKKIEAIGLDINIDMVERSKKKGLNAVEGDALSFLQNKKSNTYGAITGFHIVEHIPFNALLRIFSNAYRTLTKDGFVIFETPNPENIIVATHNFYMDPSHLHPLPPIMLAFALETCGFKSVEIKRLHPDDEHESKDLPNDIKERFYGPRDFAVIGYK